MWYDVPDLGTELQLNRGAWWMMLIRAGFSRAVYVP
jgi:hypothetical protein